MSGKGNISNQSTENAFAILEYIIGQPEPLKLTDIAKSLDMNASTVSRYITALHACGYVEQDAKTGRYKATTKICELANRFMSHFDVARLAHPFVQEISDYYGEDLLLLRGARQPGVLHRHSRQLQPYADECAADRQLGAAAQHRCRKAVPHELLPRPSSRPSWRGAGSSASRTPP